MQKSVLLIEDDVSLGSMLKQSLEREGMLVDWAQDGIMAVEMYKSFKHHIILLDIVLPRKNGFEVLREITNLGNRLPVVVITILSTEEVKKEAKDLKVDHYFIKSDTSISEIVNYVKDLLK